LKETQVESYKIVYSAADPACESFIVQLLRNSNLIIALRDPQGYFLRVSKRLERIFAATGIQPLGKTVFEVLPPELAEQIHLHDQQVLASGRHSETEEQLITGGIRRTYLTSRIPLFDGDGKINALCTIATDITTRKRTEDALSNAALAVSGAKRSEVFEQLVKYLAVTLDTEFAFIARLHSGQPGSARIIAAYLRGGFFYDVEYALAGTPCEKVFGKHFEFIPRDLQRRFPADRMMREFDFESYAAYPLYGSDGSPLGLIGVAHDKALSDRQVTESMLRIYSVRAAAEIERQCSDRALRVSEANYREIFENSEDAIFIHDFATGAIVDVNPKACANYGYSREEMRQIDIGMLSSGEPPYTPEDALRLIECARRNETVRFEWHRRNKDGSLHWDDVVLKPAVLAGQQRILAFSRDVSEHKQALEALRASEEQYRSIFNASVDGVTLWSAEGQLVDVNTAFIRMYGYSKEELLALDPRLLIHPDHRQEFDRFIETVKADKPFHVVTINRRKNGTLFDVEVNGVPMEYQGQPHLLAFVRDISERKLREDALRASEEQYRAIFKASADGMVLYSSQGRIVDINPAFVNLYGYSKQELLNMDPHQRFHPDAHPVLERFISRVRSGWYAEPANAGKDHIEETREITKDGRVLDMEAHLVAMDYQGTPHVLAIKRDITERKLREAAIRKSEDRLRATVEAALDCIISMDSQGRIIEFNPAAERCFGHPRAQVIGKPLAELLIPPAHREAHQQGLQRYWESGGGPFLGRRVEVNALRADGSEFPAELAIAVAQGADGDIFVGYLRDITEQRKAEADRSRLEQQLRQAQKMEAIGHLTGGIAHDFNNILTSILGYAQIGMEHAAPAGDEKLTKYLRQILTAGERARDLIRQMLTFSRGQRGEPRPLALPRLVEESVNLFRSTFPSSVRIHINADTGVAPVMIDPIQFEQVLMNLCINARDAMQGVGEISIGISQRVEHHAICASCRQDLQGRFVELAVADTGPGISAEVLERMFEPFFTTKEVGQGSGMGLSTTHGIVHDHGGHLMVENRPEGGMRFRVLFPAATGAIANPAADAEDPDEAGARGLRGKVLVVDDEASVREFMRELLEIRGLNVTEVRDGVQALHLLQDDGVGCDLVITDQIMPQMTGMELAYRLKAIRPGLPVILFSGFSDILTGKTPAELGVDGLLNKPVDQRELLEMIREILQH
jgi:PAS domain S-box-containing protein